jgi:hypothetical protein
MTFIQKDNDWVEIPHAVVLGVPHNAWVISFDGSSGDNFKFRKRSWAVEVITNGEVEVDCYWPKTFVRIETRSEIWQKQCVSGETISYPGAK